MGQDVDLSPVTLFADADIVVKSVLVVLLIASVVSWGIMISRTWAIFRERQGTKNIESVLGMVLGFDDLDHICSVNESVAARALRKAYDEWEWARVHYIMNYSPVRERILTAVQTELGSETARLAGRSAILATIGTTAPFIGLFGTVWGIMSSFMAIQAMQDVSLEVVAPGIAEALMATAVGLFAAIPAAFGYNRIVQQINDLRRRWGAIVNSVEIVISRSYQIVS